MDRSRRPTIGAGHRLRVHGIGAIIVAFEPLSLAITGAASLSNCSK
jgi:hypothetical protein